jgi:branched-chain amino acid transport system ATP-binding protein
MRLQVQNTFLNIENLSISFGGVAAVNDVSLKVTEGDIHAIIGPNGAGKTTIFNAISGIYKPDKGSIFFKGLDLAQLSPYKISRRGVSRTFQNIELFSQMTALENIMVGMHTSLKTGFISSALSLKRSGEAERKVESKSMEILEFLGLHTYSSHAASDLPYGQQRLLELGRALASDPKLLLLDEPGAGMNKSEIKALNNLLRRIRDQWGITILLVEHVMKLVMGISDYITVLNFGMKISEGKPGEIRNDSSVIEAYLGKGQQMA